MDAVLMTLPKIMITGANGFTGRHACNHFSERGMEVTGIVRKEEGLHLKASIAVCDLTNKDQVEQLVRRIQPDYVLHLAGRNAVSDSWKEPVSFIETNLMATVYLLSALRTAAHCRIVVAGSMLSFPLNDSPRPPHPYSLSKTMQVLAAQSWGHLFEQQVIIAQPANLIGPGFSNGVCGLIARKIVNYERGTDLSPFKLSSLVEERDYLDIRDAVFAYEKILINGKRGNVYPIGSGQTHSLGDMIAVFQTMTPKALPLEVGQLSHYIPPAPVDLTHIKALNWEPSISFKKSLEDVLNFFRNQMKNK
jgi:GDP-4-dehydro-6-deoxy-D-mannose reductase